ncbi:MAG TPA: SCO family protein [Bdellovibrionales bacterium]|jgi:protein SCO1/2|nr:SCO family protein [Bdellovibrionales bacterium]
MIKSNVITKLLAFALIPMMGSATAFARDTLGIKEGLANETPQELKDVGIDQKLGDKIDLDLPFTDHTGKAVTLRSYVADGKPLLLSLAYYNCPSLCNFHLNGLLDAFKQMKQPLGQEFHAVAISIEPKETADLAQKKRETYLKSYARPEGEKGWHFLVGQQPAIDSIAKEIGFKYHWDETEQQWAHASAAVVITPDGTISRYLNGIVFDPKTVRLSMIEASNGKVGSVIDKLVLYCFHFDPKTSKYSLYAFNVMRGGAVLIVLLLAIFILPFWIRNSRAQGEAT